MCVYVWGEWMHYQFSVYGIWEFFGEILQLQPIVQQGKKCFQQCSCTKKKLLFSGRCLVLKSGKKPISGNIAMVKATETSTTSFARHNFTPITMA